MFSIFSMPPAQSVPPSVQTSNGLLNPILDVSNFTHSNSICQGKEGDLLSITDLQNNIFVAQSFASIGYDTKNCRFPEKIFVYHQGFL